MSKFGQRFARVVDWAVDGLIAGIYKIPPILIGVPLGLGLGWIGWIVSTTELPDDTPLASEGSMYYAEPLTTEDLAAAAQAASAVSQAASGAASAPQLQAAK